MRLAVEIVDFVHVARLPCRHEYCRECLDGLFEASMTDESLFPPRCCRQPIPVASVRLFLKLELVQEFARKTIEFGTPNRTYCHSPTCSTFIHPRNIDGESAYCDQCGRHTCVTCKAAGHTGDCPHDTALQQVLETAQDMGWQRCYSCRSVVELEHGCNHMTYFNPPDDLLCTNILTDVAAELNFVMSVENLGRTVPASSGTRIVSMLVRI